MRTYRLLAAAALMIAAGTSAQADNDAWARKMFSEQKHDFGVLTRGLDARHEITITNPYDETITVVDVSTTCGCTAGSVSQRTLRPGEQAVVEIKMNTVKFKRHKNSNVDVTLRRADGRIAKVRIPIHAYIREDVTLSKDTVDFGTVPKGVAQEQTITVMHSGLSPWKIVGIRPGKNLDVSYSQPRLLNGKTVYDLTFRVRDDSPIGTIKGNVIVLTEEPARSYLSIPIRGRVEPAFTVATSVINMGTVNPSEEEMVRVVVRGLRPFAIETIQSTGKAMASSVRIPMPDQSKLVHVVPMSVETPAAAGPFREEFSIKISGEEETLHFTVEGKVVPSDNKNPLVSDSSGKE